LYNVLICLEETHISKVNPSTITFHTYDGLPLEPLGIHQNVPIEFKNKTILIDINVVDFPLYYNILLGHSYIYSMKAIASLIFHTMIFHHEGKVVTIDQLQYYKLNFPPNLNNIFPTVTGSMSFPIPMDISPRILKDLSLLGVYYEPPSEINSLDATSIDIVSSIGSPFLPSVTPSLNISTIF
jgi:hypothetical protein